MKKTLAILSIAAMTTFSANTASAQGLLGAGAGVTTGAAVTAVIAGLLVIAVVSSDDTTSGEE